MRKFLLVLAVLFLLMVVGVAAFIATFDADRYRPLLVSELQKALGRPVTLEHISLGWHGGIAVELRELAIREDAPTREPLIQVGSTSALVRLAPLLHKEVQVSSVRLLRPHIHLVRDAQGRINLLGLAVAASPAAGATQKTTVGGTPVSFQIGLFQIQEGTVHWIDRMMQPPLDLQLNALDVTVQHIALGRPMDLELRGVLLSDHDNIHLTGRLTLPNPPAQGSVERASLMLERLPIEQLLPAARPGEPQLHGQLTVNLSGELPTLDSSQMLRTMAWKGSLKLTDAVVVNLNVLRSVFEQLSMLPGLVQRLEARLPPEYQAKLAEKDTALSPIDVSVNVETGALHFGQLDLRSDTFDVAGAGEVGADGAVLVRSTLRITPSLSTAIVNSVNELGALTNKTGELEIPLTIQGQAPRVAVLPDLNYLASKLISRKAVDVLQNLLERKRDTNSPSSSKPSNASSQTPSTEDLVGDLLQRAFKKKKHAPSDAGSPP